jgi:hypothetical protein
MPDLLATEVDSHIFYSQSTVICYLVEVYEEIWLHTGMELRKEKLF